MEHLLAVNARLFLHKTQTMQYAETNRIQNRCNRDCQLSKTSVVMV